MSPYPASNPVGDRHCVRGAISSYRSANVCLAVHVREPKRNYMGELDLLGLRLGQRQIRRRYGHSGDYCCRPDSRAGDSARVSQALNTAADSRTRDPTATGWASGPANVGALGSAVEFAALDPGDQVAERLSADDVHRAAGVLTVPDRYRVGGDCHFDAALSAARRTAAFAPGGCV